MAFRRFKRQKSRTELAPSDGARLNGPGAAIQYRTVHGYKRAFVHTGSGPALLLIHGIGDSSDTWSELIPSLARTHTVVAPDLKVLEDFMASTAPALYEKERWRELLRQGSAQRPALSDALS